MSFYQDWGKRVLDIFVVVLLMPFWIPVWVFCAIWVFLWMGRPIFFTQERPGLHGKVFRLFKFRTMSHGIASDAERLTGFGKILRMTSLDELPSLFNILKGDMSLVGPRPLLVQYLDLYTLEQMRRHDVRPGLTGLAQVNGRNLISWDEKFKFDIEYVHNLSFGLDILILLRTIHRVLFQYGISAKDSVTMPEFRGPTKC